MRHRIVFVLALALVACSPTGGSDGGNGSPVTVSGEGIATTSKFHLDGDYIVAWTATPRSDTGCYHGAQLQSSDVSGSKLLGNDILDSASPQTGSTNVYGLDDGDYFLKVSSGCSWTYIFTPQ